MRYGQARCATRPAVSSSVLQTNLLLIPGLPRRHEKSDLERSGRAHHAPFPFVSGLNQ